MKQWLIPEAYAVYPLLVLRDIDKAWQHHPPMKFVSLFFLVFVSSFLLGSTINSALYIFHGRHYN